MGRLLPALLVAAASLAGCSGDEGERAGSGSGASSPDLLPPEVARGLSGRLERFVPVTLEFDTTLLDADRRRLVRLLVEASDHLDAIFLEQVWRGNAETRAALAADRDAPGVAEALRLFDIMYGPWDRLEENEPFLAVGPKPPGAGYYPEDLTREEAEAWLAEHPGRRDAFTSYYTVVRRRGRDLEAVPYSRAYRRHLEPAAALLLEAAALADNESLRRFLEQRAASFLSDDYFESEVAWMRIEGNLIEPTIGPYEVYEDALFGYKTAFESFITLKDPGASALLQSLVEHLRELEAALPVADEHKSLDRSFASPISVVDVIYAAGDAREGVQTIAFNLPNDPRVTESEGSKKVMLRNVIRAKFERILRPIASVVLEPAQAERIGFEPYFTRVLLHELAHGLGPKRVTGRPELTVSQALRERHSAIEEAKADAVGTHGLRVLAERGVYGRAFVEEVYIDHVADLFRCVRFGVTEAHGLGCLTQFNFLREAGAIRLDGASGRFAADLDRMPDAIADLARRYLTLQGTGDYEAAGAFLERYGTVPEELASALARLETVPVDIRPRYAVREYLMGW